MFPLLLAGLFVLLILLSWPKGCLYGSTIDWYSQHVILAETIRTACLEERTLAPAWLSLGGGSNGYQFAYYGYFRPDILIGCLMPEVPMMIILPVYMLAGYLIAVLLLYRWLRDEGREHFFAFLGSALFLMAVCFFQTHRQIMFINYMPFLILALMMLRKKKYAWVCICLFLIYLHSFYYAIACLAVVAWYWYRLEGSAFFRRCLVTVSLSIGMAMMLLLPAFLAILEHKHSGERATTAADLFMPNLQNLLYHPYGMGLTVLSLYLLLVGLGYKKYRKTSIVFLFVTVFGVASWVLNATLYARAKILIPFVPLLILHNITVFEEMHQGKQRWHIWPFAVFVPAVLSQWKAQWFTWIAVDMGIVLGVVLLSGMMQSGNRKCRRNHIGSARRKFNFRQFILSGKQVCYLPLLVMPALIYLRMAQGESWAEVPEQAAFLKEEKEQIYEDPLYRFDSIFDAVNEGNALDFAGQQKTTMYSSVTNAAYQDVYYNLLATPIQINNRTALLAEQNPFLQNLMGVRYLETTEEKIPVGYEIMKQKDGAVIAENPSVLPIAYTTSDCMSVRQFETLDPSERLEAISRYTVVPEAEDVSWIPSGKTVEMGKEVKKEIEKTNAVLEISNVNLSDGIQIEETENGYRLNVKKAGSVTVELKETVKDILLLQFQVKNRTGSAVVISANGIKNKLSGSTAPYPNENYCFSYPLSEKEGIKSITFELSKGSYDITYIQVTTYPMEIFSEKEAEPVTLKPKGEKEKSVVLSCRADAAEDGYFVTSIPRQRGMHLYMDGEEAEIETVNQAFAGAKISKGNHEVELKFIPPGQRIGYLVSLFSVILLLGSRFYFKGRVKRG